MRRNGRTYSGRVVSLQYNWLENRVVYMAMIVKPQPGGKETLFHYKADKGMEIVAPEQPAISTVPEPTIREDMQMDRPVRESPSKQLIELLCKLVERPMIMEYLVKQEPELLNQSMIMLYGGYEHERLDPD